MEEYAPAPSGLAAGGRSDSALLQEHVSKRRRETWLQTNIEELQKPMRVKIRGGHQVPLKSRYQCALSMMAIFEVIGSKLGMMMQKYEQSKDV
mmetsp:Transcript_32065/g.96087  ORF Transcript_32065/g.96087 Transcript_32065/m.96087 type:complete len:93 (-) Transcript_32065:1467-1745(-)